MQSRLFYSPGRARSLAWPVFVVGALGTAVVAVAGEDERFWSVLLANLLFWSGISMSGVVFSAVIEMTNASWGRPFKRIAEAGASFLPISFVLFVVVILFGAGTLGWNAGEIKRIWLTMPFLAVRDIFCLIVLYSVSLYYVYVSLRPDLGKLNEDGKSPGPAAKKYLLSGWEGTEQEVMRKQRSVKVFAPLVIILYCFVASLIAGDFIMALDPEWYSTLFGGYFFMGNLYLGLAFVAVAALRLSDSMSLTEIKSRHFHDLGKLMLGFCLVSADFFWLQFLVIWFGNLPEETGFVIKRIKEDPWSVLGWTVLIVCYMVPAILLFSRRLKVNRVGMTVLSSVILIGMWIEKFMLVVPSIYTGETIPLGFPELLITAAFAGAFILCFTGFLRVFPVFPLTDPLFIEETLKNH